MEEPRPLKVVPSGKVYRQKFDAEVQLVKALGETEERRKSRDPTFHMSKEGTGIPLVRISRQATGTGMLTSRQRTWIEGFPNESYQENPVLYKFYSDDNTYRDEPMDKEGQEVRGLPDIVVPTKKGSDIIERIAESRRLRHDTAVEEMHQELGVISSELEPHIIESGQQLMAKLSENDKDIEKEMCRIEHDDALMKFTKPELEELWKVVADQSVIRQYWIKELDSCLEKVEQERMDGVKDIFVQYSQHLEKIAHLMMHDLQRLLDHESQLINQQVLSNRRAYADLYARLMMADIEREKKLHTQWKRRFDDWKKLHTEQSCSNFERFMESEHVLYPVNANELLDQMKEDQELLNTKRLELINSIRSFRPPASTKTAVYQWNKKITDISKQIDKLNMEHFNNLHKQYEKVCQDCLAEVERIKTDLIKHGVCSTHKAKLVIQERCLPLVGQRQSGFEKDLEIMDKTFEKHNSGVLKQLRSVFKYCQGVAHVWDVHELGLAKTERALQEKLDECRRKHDNENQDKEANLDITMDRMRQEASETSLQDSLKKALEMLDKIRDGYDTFHLDQSGIVQTYPDMVDLELKRYDGTVCKFFSISRNHPDDAPKEEPTPHELAVIPSPRNKRRSSTKKRTPSSARDSIKDDEKPATPVQQTVSEILSTSKGTTFYVLTVAGEHGVPPEGDRTDRSEGDLAFLTGVPNQPTEDESMPDYVRNVDVPESLLVEIKKQVRMNFLDHLEDWSTQAIERSSSVVAAKCEELNSELDLRLHLHKPRSRRAELDVHNVRAAELVMHSERVVRHCKGIVQSLSDLKQRFSQMTLEHNKLAQKFRKDIESLETVFVNATKSSKLVALSNQLQTEQDKYMGIIRASLRQFRQHLDETLQMLRESNARFIKSFKVFSDGGNFCPEEIEDFRKKLEKMSHKIDSAEGFIMADLEGMESKRLDQAMKISNEFEDRFKHHMIDLVFMEKIARWLTNTQVKIKAEVADSNSQAQRLSQFNSELERRIDACLRPNLDKESVTPSLLYESLKPIFDSFHERSMYLNCAKFPMGNPGTPTMQGAAGTAGCNIFTLARLVNKGKSTKVGFAAAADVGPIIRGKHTIEDPSVSVIKHILKTQKSRLGIDVDDMEEKEKKPVRKANVTTTILQVAPETEQSSDVRETMSKSRMSHRSKAESHMSRKSGKSGSSNDTTKRVQSGTTRGMFSKNKGIDKKYFIFGEFSEENEDQHFLGKTKRILRESLDGLLSSAEIFYRQKGSRHVTRPQALQETFEICADTVTTKLESYHKQADEYHNECLQELRRQLDKLEDLLYEVPNCVINEFLSLAKTDANEDQEALDRQFSTQLRLWNDTKAEHKAVLRPSLGHPNAHGDLEVLMAQERERRDAYLTGVEQHTKTLQGSAARLGQEFIQKLASLTESMLIDFDKILTLDDVEKGRVPTVKHPTAELVRRKNAGIPLEDGDPKEKVPRGKKSWQGVPKNEIVNPNAEIPREQVIKEKAMRRGRDGKKKEAPSNLTADVITQKHTLAHKATVEARNMAYQEYKKHFESTLKRIDVQKEAQLIAEQRWTDSWHTSVDKVKELY